MERKSGLLLPILSLPGKFGIGTLGEEAIEFIRFLKSSRQKLWQICPLTHPSKERSPYISYSAFAGNPLFIDPEELYKKGLITKLSLKRAEVINSGRIDYSLVEKKRSAVLNEAYRTYKKLNKNDLRRAFNTFISNNEHWLLDYARFILFKNLFKTEDWKKWPTQIRNRKRKDIAYYDERFCNEIEETMFSQFIFFQQWSKLKEYANRNGIGIVGDIPIFVSFGSADVWANKSEFQLDRDHNPKHVAGVPPDYFSKTGQLWGNPLYDWKKMKKNRYRWWMEVIEHQVKLYDLTRIDHFRGLIAYYKIPYGDKNAIRGHWARGPSLDFFSEIKKRIKGLPFVLEDLGVITRAVREVKEKLGLPGMVIAQFELEGSGIKGLRQVEKNRFIYTGTHDNDTTLGWFSKLTKEKQTILQNELNVRIDELSWKVVDLVLHSPADVSVIPVQDLLNLGSSARLNIPNVYKNIYRWRMKNRLEKEIASNLLRLTMDSKR